MSTATETKPATKFQPKDVYQQVTDTIIEQLEAGVIPWQQPWTGNNDHKALSLPYNYNTGNYYRGVNIVLLWSSAIKHKFVSGEWGSFKQWQGKNEAIRKDEKGSIIVYYDTFEKEIDGEVKKIPFLKASYVFNRCQLKSYDPDTVQEPEQKISLVDKIDKIDEFLNNTKAIIEQHDGGPCYNIKDDKILIPFHEQFKSTKTCTATEGFYCSTFHELTHWTGAKHRLNRLDAKKFGDQSYANEELVAEFGAAFLCAGFGIRTLEKGDHAGYISHWLKVLKENNRCLLSAASEASKAVDYLL